jgi:hypothetical protein
LKLVKDRNDKCKNMKFTATQKCHNMDWTRHKINKFTFTNSLKNYQLSSKSQISINHTRASPFKNSHFIASFVKIHNNNKQCAHFISVKQFFSVSTQNEPQKKPAKTFTTLRDHFYLLKSFFVLPHTQFFLVTRNCGTIFFIHFVMYNTQKKDWVWEEKRFRRGMNGQFFLSSVTTAHTFEASMEYWWQRELWCEVNFRYSALSLSAIHFLHYLPPTIEKLYTHVNVRAYV